MTRPTPTTDALADAKALVAALHAPAFCCRRPEAATPAPAPAPGGPGPGRARRMGSPAALALALAALEPDPDALVVARAEEWWEQFRALEDARQALLEDRPNWLAGKPMVQLQVVIVRGNATQCC